MRENNNNKRTSTRGTGRTGNAGSTFGRKPARRYSAAEGSVYGSADESSAKRGYSSRDSRGSKPAGKPFRDEKPFGKDSRGGKPFGKEARGGKPFGKSQGEKPYGKSAAGRSFDKGGNSFGRGAKGNFREERDFEERGNRSFGEREFTGKRAYGMVGKTLEERKNYRGVQNYTPTQRAPKAKADEGVRLNKYIANSGICSRREADDYITAGLVSVNGVTITELGTRVYPNDVVRFNDERIKGEQKVYIVMNKPKDFVTTVSDPHAERTVMQLVEGKCAERVYPVGRLDKATTGVLLLTNDGELADKLTHPSFEKKKIYHVFLDKNFKRPDMDALLEGVKLEDGFIQADAISYIDGDQAQVGVEIHSGRNRIVRRMFEHFGYKVKKLDRVYFAGLTKKNLRRGQWRFLTDLEVSMLKMGSFE